MGGTSEKFWQQGLAFFRAEEYGKAINAFRRFLAQVPSSEYELGSFAHMHIGECLEKLGDPASALREHDFSFDYCPNLDEAGQLVTLTKRAELLMRNPSLWAGEILPVHSKLVELLRLSAGDYGHASQIEYALTALPHEQFSERALSGFGAARAYMGNDDETNAKRVSDSVIALLPESGDRNVLLMRVYRNSFED